VETSFQGVTLQKIGGDASVHTEHGDVSLTDVMGAVDAQASFDDVTLMRIAGPVDVAVEHGGLKANDLEKGARVRVAGDEVVLEGFRGVIDVQAQRAGIQLVPAAALSDAVTASTTHGGIRLEVPRESRFDLEATAENGEVQVDLPGLVLTRSDSARVSGKIGGGGNVVKLAADHGDVRVGAPAAVAAKNP